VLGHELGREPARVVQVHGDVTFPSKAVLRRSADMLASLHVGTDNARDAGRDVARGGESVGV